MRKNSEGFIQIIVVILLLVVVAGGAYYFGKNQNKLSVNLIPTPQSTNQPVNQLTPVPTVSTRPSASPFVKTTDPALSWKTYTNTKYGFSFQYPTNTKVMGDINGLTYTMIDNGKAVTVMIGNNSQKNSIQDYFLNQIQPQEPQSISKYVSFKDLKNGTSNLVWAAQDPNFFKLQTTGLNNYLIATPTNYIVNFNVQDSASLEPSSSLINQILSTFKFTK